VFNRALHALVVPASPAGVRVSLVERTHVSITSV
jgi:hypothetical protein